MTYTGRHIHLWYKLQLNIRLPKKKTRDSLHGFSPIRKKQFDIYFQKSQMRFFGETKGDFFGGGEQFPSFRQQGKFTWSVKL